MFNFCTEEEKVGKSDDKLAYSDFIFAFKLTFALGGRRGKKDRETSKHDSEMVTKTLGPQHGQLQYTQAYYWAR